ncbi:hypothetical protein BVX94_03630 [bacterium B17]|nr:hypothetical protein BVX94_03630 [bacterium B17]
MKDSKIVITLVAGILIGLALRGISHSDKGAPAFRDKSIHSYLVNQIQAAPGIAKLESLQMGFDGKSLLAIVLPKDGKAKAEISYTLSDGGYYQANGQWNFDVGSALTLWPYKID